MSDLTETEIVDCLKTNFRLAAEHCEDLASFPLAGPTYTKLRAELKLIEGAARQLAGWREDARWLKIGLDMGEAHKRAGNWLRGHHPRKLFLMLAANLRMGLAVAERLRTARTGIIGPILPTVLEGPHRDTRPVQVITPGGIILPASMH